MDDVDAENTIPTVDLSQFFSKEEEGRKLATDTIAQACQTYGFFRIINHGVPAELMARALDLSKQFFALPDEEKHKVKPIEGSKAPLPAGYARQPEHSKDKNEYFMVFSPDLGFNPYPDQPAEFKLVIFNQTCTIVFNYLSGIKLDGIKRSQCGKSQVRNPETRKGNLL